MKPAYNPEQKINILALGADRGITDLRQIFARQMEAEYFPVELDNMGAQFSFILHDKANLESYMMAFARQPYRLLTAESGAQAIEILKEEPVDVVLTDLRMPEVDGLEVVAASAGMAVPCDCSCSQTTFRLAR